MKYAEGSCLIELANTRVICTASVDMNIVMMDSFPDIFAQETLKEGGE